MDCTTPGWLARANTSAGDEGRGSAQQKDDDVRAFADELGIGPDIVVGRLQFEQRWAYNRGNNLKRRFVFTSGSE